MLGPLLRAHHGGRVSINSPGTTEFTPDNQKMANIRQRLIAIIRTLQPATEPAPQVCPVFPMAVEQETPLQQLDNMVDRVAKLRHQGYSLRAVASELGISYHKARKIAQAVAA